MAKSSGARGAALARICPSSSGQGRCPSPIRRRSAVRLMARPNNFPPTARHAAREARQALADERAAKLAPLIKALQAAGVTSLNGLAVALNARGVLTPAGGGEWHATQVARLLKRLAG